MHATDATFLNVVAETSWLNHGQTQVHTDQKAIVPAFEVHGAIVDLQFAVPRIPICVHLCQPVAKTA